MQMTEGLCCLYPPCFQWCQHHFWGKQKLPVLFDFA